MQTVVVIADERDEKIRELVANYVVEKKYFICLALSECNSEIALSTIESADIVLVAVELESAKRLHNGCYPSTMYDKTIYICPKRNRLTTWFLKDLYNHAVVCRQGELYNSLKAFLEILAHTDFIDIQPAELLSFCKAGISQIFYFEAEKRLITRQLVDVRKRYGKRSNLLIGVIGAVSLADVEKVVYALGTQEGNLTVGVGFREDAQAIKVCLLVNNR